MADFNPEQLKKNPGFDLCSTCEETVMGETPNSSTMLKCYTCWMSERQALMSERTAALKYMEWQEGEIRAREGDLACMAATVAAEKARSAKLEEELKRAVSQLPLAHRTAPPKAAYLGPISMVVMDRYCTELFPPGLNFYKALDAHKGLRARSYGVCTIPTLCQKAAAELS